MRDTDFEERIIMGTARTALALCLFGGILVGTGWAKDQKKHVIKAIYIPLADHYAGVVAYEKYRGEMKHADYQIEKMKSWPLLRACFMSGKADVAYIICPMAMDMFRERPNFRWVSLLHRDGNALAINDLLNEDVGLPQRRVNRKPDAKVANALVKAKNKIGRPTECGVPHLQSTHTVVLYKYLKDHGKTLGLRTGRDRDLIAIEVPPPKSPAFIKKNNSRATPASFEQSLPWADVVETRGFGHVAWYSKDVMPWPNGHVECLAIASDDCIKNKTEALKEVIYYIHKAGHDIESARQIGIAAMEPIVKQIRAHIPAHTEDAIVQSLRLDLNVINYRHLNVDKNAKEGLKQIMDLAVEGGILRQRVDIDALAEEGFATEITEQEIARLGADHLGIGKAMTEATKQRLMTLVNVLEGHAANPLLVRAVKEQNAKEAPLDEIKAIDKDWQSGGRQELALSLQTNRVATFLREEVLKGNHHLTEAFVCDRQGAVVSEHPKTSDYWQGDEEKFTASYNDGIGRVFIGPLQFDDSTKTYSVQVSVPVKDGDKAIGVVVLGVRNIK